MTELSTQLKTITAFPKSFRPRRKHFDIPRNFLFSSLSRQQLRIVQPFIKQRQVKAGKRILEEGARNHGKIYIVLQGQITMTKQGISPLRNGLTHYDIGTLQRGQIFGEMSFLDDKPLLVGYVAKSDVTIALVDLSASRLSHRVKRVRRMVSARLRHYLASRLDKSIELRLQIARIEDDFSHYRYGVGHIVVTTLCLLSIYTLTLSFLPNFKSVAHANFAVSPLVILLFSLSFGPIIATSGFPRSFFGLQIRNWKAALGFSIQWSILFLLGLAFAKLILINSLSSFSDHHLIEMASIEISGEHVSSSLLYIFAVSIYLLLTPMQEFVARSGIQAPLYAFLHGSETKRRWVSILASNFVFAAAHAHISLAFAISAFVPGIFWGWIFHRTNSLLAATASHLIVGSLSIFVFDIEAIINLLPGSF